MNALCVAAVCSIVVASIDTEILQDVTILSTYPCGKAKAASSNLTLKICANHALYLASTEAMPAPGAAAATDSSPGHATISHGAIVAGYNKGKWQTTRSGDAASPKEISYTLHDSSDHVVFNGHVTTVGKLISEKRLTTEADLARCCYHEIVDDPKDDDLILEGAGQKVVVDSISLPFLANAVIDFSEELIGARFVIENPNATSACGCGTSFSM